MNTFKFTVFFLLVISGLGLSSCTDHEVNTSEVTLNLTVKNSNQNNHLIIKDGTFTFKDVSTGAENTVAYKQLLSRAAAESTLLSLTNGLYNLTFIGTATYTYQETVLEEQENGESIPVEITKTVEVGVQGAQQNIEVKNGNITINLTVYVQGAQSKDNFVIAEIFSSGTLNPSTGKQYNGDQYIRIYNNSHETLYADGLILIESEFTTVKKMDYTPNVMEEAMTAQVIAMIPGTGKEHPIEPGKSILICDNAINHQEANSNSIDLSQADFEWYTQSTIASYPDVDNPDVPNLSMIYNYTKSIWVLTKQGNRAYAIAKMPEGMTSEDYLNNYTYSYHYTLNGKPTKDKTGYKIPNEWVLDAVNLSPKNTYVWNVTSQELDMGYTYLGESATIANNIGKAVVRKVSYTDEHGLTILQDTNNSSIDFTPSTSATLLPAN